MSESSGSIIRATAKYQEAGEPVRQRPIIRIDATTTTHYIEAADLANTVRATIDTGHDNPFRPDGEIYRSVDPIVDYYKFGPNQSRTQSPAYSDLVADSRDTTNATVTRDNKKDEPRQQKRQRPAGSSASRLCSKWRNWLCCCFGCRKNNGSDAKANEDNHAQMHSNLKLAQNGEHHHAKLHSHLAPSVSDRAKPTGTKLSNTTANGQSDDNLRSSYQSSHKVNSCPKSNINKLIDGVKKQKTNEQNDNRKLLSFTSSPAMPHILKQDRDQEDDELLTSTTPSINIEEDVVEIQAERR